MVGKHQWMPPDEFVLAPTNILVPKTTLTHKSAILGPSPTRPSHLGISTHFSCAYILEDIHRWVFVFVGFSCWVFPQSLFPRCGKERKSISHDDGDKRQSTINEKTKVLAVS
jgi:hypothetical protein